MKILGYGILRIRTQKRNFYLILGFERKILCPVTNALPAFKQFLPKRRNTDLLSAQVIL